SPGKVMEMGLNCGRPMAHPLEPKRCGILEPTANPNTSPPWPTTPTFVLSTKHKLLSSGVPTAQPKVPQSFRILLLGVSATATALLLTTANCTSPLNPLQMPACGATIPSTASPTAFTTSWQRKLPVQGTGC